MIALWRGLMRILKHPPPDEGMVVLKMGVFFVRGTFLQG